MPLETRPKVIREVIRMALDPDENPRDKLRAAESLLRQQDRQIAAAMAQIAQEKWKREKDGGGVDLPKLLEADAEYEANGAGHPDEVPQ